MGPDDQRLGFEIGNTADPELSLHLQNILVKFRPEVGCLDVVNRTVKALYFVVDSHSCPARTQMRVIISTVKQIKNAVVL